MVERHLFVQGPINVGKTTLIEKFIKSYEKENNCELARFKTVAQKDPNGSSAYFLYYQNVAYPIAASKKRDGQDWWYGLSETFESTGIECLDQMQNTGGLVVIDELGFFESKAPNFQKKVFSLLDDPNCRVLGVLKNKPIAFLEKIRDRDDVCLLNINLDNRNDLMPVLDKFFRRSR